MFLYKTNRGRVVYNRKPHAFTSRDVRRITRKSDILYYGFQTWVWKSFVSAYRDFIAEFLGQVEYAGSGGEFGGAGVTRDFKNSEEYESDPLLRNGIIVVIREE